MPSSAPISKGLGKATLVKGLVALLFISAIAKVMQGQRPAEPFTRIDLLYVGLSVLLSFGMVALSCVKWRVLLGVCGHRLPFGAMMRFYFIGYFFSNLLPSSIGGDVVRSWYCGERIGNQADAAVSVFLERFTGLLMLLFLAVFGPLIVPGLYGQAVVFLAVLFAVALLSLVCLFIVMRDPVDLARRLADLFLGWFPRGRALCEPIFRMADTFHGKLRDALRVLRRRPGALAWVMLLTLAFYLLTWLNIAIAFQAFSVPVGSPEWRGILAVTAVAMLAGVLPIAPLGAFGLLEFSYVTYFSKVGFAKADTLAMGILLRMKVVMLGIIGVCFYLAGSKPDRG